MILSFWRKMIEGVNDEKLSKKGVSNPNRRNFIS
jgi:hypothetical protein